MAVLRALQGPNQGEILPLEGASVILGRHPACDIVLQSAAVSRHHARIVNVGDAYYLEDLHSRNGTFLNGRPVGQRQLLSDNDEVGICDLAFAFHFARPPTGITPPLRRIDVTTDALLVDDDEPPEQAMLSKLNLPSGSSSMRLEVNTEAKLKALVEISRHLGRSIGMDEVLPKLLDSLFAIFIASRPRVRRAPRSANQPAGSQGGEASPLEDAQTVRISRTIVNNVMAGKEAMLSADAASDSRFDMAESIVDFRIRSMMCAPLVDHDGVPLGVIQLDTLDPRNRFRQDRPRRAGERGLPGGVRRGKCPTARSRDSEPVDPPRAGDGPRGAAWFSPFCRAAYCGVRFLRVLRIGPVNSAAITTTMSNCLAAGWPSWWPTCPAKAFPRRC